jgi:hypothetical protein
VSPGLAGIVLLAGLVWTEKRTPQPIVRLRLLADRLFASTTAVMFTGMMAFLGSLYLMVLFLQDGLGLSALDAGLSTFPEAIGVMAGAQIAGRLYPRFGPRRAGYRQRHRADRSRYRATGGRPRRRRDDAQPRAVPPRRSRR